MYVTVPPQMTPVRISETEFVPARFLVEIALVRPKLQVEMEVRTAPGSRPVVRELLVKANADTRVTTSVLRRVLVDQLLRAAVDEAAKPTSGVTVPDVAGHAFTADDGVWVGPLPQPLRGRGSNTANEKAERAAKIYNDAVSSGSKKPGEVVADAMHVSRSQAARYIRRARNDLHLIPTLSGGDDGEA